MENQQYDFYYSAKQHRTLTEMVSRGIPDINGNNKFKGKKGGA